MRTKLLSFAIFLFLCCTILEAEDQKRNDSNEKTTQIATTADGRKVILKSDGTWEYYKEPVAVMETPAPAAPKETPVTKETPPSVTAPKEAPPVKETPLVQETPPVKDTAPPVVTPPPAIPNQIQKSTLSFDVAVALQPGDSKPITGGTFYLLDNDLNNILGSANLKLEKGLSLLNTFSMANYGATLGVERSVKNFTKAMDAIKPHVVATTTSDFNGKGQFSALNPGTYYLMNTSIIFLNTGSLNDRKAILWNVKVQVQPGENSIRLDEKNTVP